MAESATDLSEGPGHLRARGKARAAIIGATRAIAAEDGAGAVSFKAVAERCEMAPSAVYPFFPTKSELLQAVVADDMDDFFRSYRHANGMPEPGPHRPATPTRIVRFELRPAPPPKKEVPQIEVANAQSEEAVTDGVVAQLAEIALGDVRAIAAGFEGDEPKASANDETAAADIWAQSIADDVYCLITVPLGDVRTAPEPEPTPAKNEKAEGPSNAAPAPPEPPAPTVGDVVASDAAITDKRVQAKPGRVKVVGKKSVVTTALEETAERIVPADSTTDSIARLEETVAKLESGNWDRFERRLHVLESALASLEKSYEATNITSKTAQAAAQESTDAIKKFAERLDAVEKRQGDTLMKMSAQLKEATHRLDDIEPARFGANATVLEPAPEMGDPPPPAPEAAGEPNSPAASSSPLGTTSDETQSAAAKPSNYLSAARKAAISANEVAVASDKVEEGRRARRGRMLLGAAIGFAVLLVAITVVVNEISSFKPASVVQHAPVAKHFDSHVTVMAPLDFLTAAAKAGNDKAELIVGLKYLAGDGVAKSETDSAQWVARAAEKGNAVAEYVLATLYQSGRGVAADPAQGATWYERAAMQGNRKAMHNLAVAYAEGKGVPQDYSEAARWFSRAADLGYVDSAFNLAVLYERGDGVPQSLLDAYKWYAVAAAAGDVESKTRLSALETQLSADDLAAAQATAASFKPQSYAHDTNDTPKLADLAGSK